MREVKLKFPDIATMAEFILTPNDSQITTRNEDKTSKGLIPDEPILAACQGYGAVKIIQGLILKETKPYFSFD